MRKFIIISLMLVFVISFDAESVWSKGIPYKPIEIPPEIKELTAISQLKPFLNESNENIRRAAIRRLGQLNGKEVVKILSRVFEKEPYKAEFEVKPMVKLEVINTLKEIGNEEAKVCLLDILNTYLENGPQIKNKKYFYRDGDYLSVTLSALDALYNWRDDEDIYKLYEKVAFNEEIPGREKAYEMYLRVKLYRDSIEDLKDSVPYLVGLLTGTGAGHPSDWVKGKEGVRTTESIKNGAIINILIKYGKPALPYLKKELKRISPTEKDRIEALNYVIRRIETSPKVLQSESVGPK